MVYSNQLEKHREHIQVIIAKLQEAGLSFKLSEYGFEMQSMSFIRYFVMLKGIEMKQDKICIIAE